MDKICQQGHVIDAGANLCGRCNSLLVNESNMEETIIDNGGVIEDGEVTPEVAPENVPESAPESNPAENPAPEVAPENSDEEGAPEVPVN